MTGPIFSFVPQRLIGTNADRQSKENLCEHDDMIYTYIYTYIYIERERETKKERKSVCV